MRKLLRCSTAGLAVLLTTAYVAVSAETGINAFRPTVFEPAPATASLVNRTNKGDRELTLRDPRSAAPPKQLPGKTAQERILEGCDPAFSPLMASAKNNFSGRCIAALDLPMKMAMALQR